MSGPETGAAREARATQEAGAAQLERVDLGEVPTWIRLRIALFASLITFGVGLLLDMLLVFVLPLPPDVVRNSRLDILLSLPAVVAVVAAVTAVELRVVAATRRTARLGLQLPESQRQRALRTALSFPVLLPAAMVVAGTLGNAVTFVLDILGRSSTPWYAVHITIITQCLVLCGAFPIFAFARFTLRPFVLAVAADGEDLGRSVGLRGRVALLVSTLVALVAVPTTSVLSLQLDRRVEGAQRQRMRDVVTFLGHEATEMGLHSFRRWVHGVDVEPDVVPFVLASGDGAVPSARRGLLARARLGPPVVGAGPVWAEVGKRQIVAVPALVGEGRTAWIGVIYVPAASGRGRPALLGLVLGLFGLASLLGVLLGAGIAREVQAVTGQVQALVDGGSPEPLSAEVGGLAEVGGAIDAVNALLAAADALRVRGFLEAEASADAARSKTEFLANMSHDLRSPLTAILGFVDFLGREINGPLDAEQRDQVERIAEASNRLVALIDVLLDGAKAEAGRLKLNRAWTPVAAVVSRAMDLFAMRTGRAAGRQVRIEVEAGLAPIHVDPDRTAQAVSYLLEELHRAGPEAALSIQAGLTSGESHRSVTVVLASDGPSSLDPARADLFEPLREGPSGAVLSAGPSLARHLVTSQHGRLAALPRSGNRTGFQIRFAVNVTGELPVIRG